MEKLASQVLQSTISQNRKVLVQDGAWERFQGFLHAIDWREVRAAAPPSVLRPGKGRCIRRFRRTPKSSTARARFLLTRGLPSCLQPWIAGTLAAYVALLTVVVATRRRPNVQLVIFVAVCGAVYCSQYLNDYGAAQWRPLGFTQNYFDKYGIFISLLFSGPLLLIGMFQMVRRSAQEAGGGRGGACHHHHHTRLEPVAAPCS